MRDLATQIRWQRTTSIEQTHPGVYCLRSNQTEWDATTLWRTYTLLTDLEAVFRCLKSELGLQAGLPPQNQACQQPPLHLGISLSSGAHPPYSIEGLRH